MPIYEYKCLKCEHQFEVIQRFTDNPVESCPECNNKSVQKLVSAPSFRSVSYTHLTLPTTPYV